MKDAERRVKSGKSAPRRTKFGKGRTPLADDKIGAVEGIPSETQIRERLELKPRDLETFNEVYALLAEHLGSYAAARLWLVSKDTGFQTTALDSIREGKVKVVLETLKSQLGPKATYS